MIATIHGETLHNHFHGNTLAEGDLFLLDSGAETAMGYAGDLSSTFPVSPRFNDRQRTIYELQLAAHEAAVAILAPGVPNRDVHFAAARVIADGMKDLGLMKGDTEEALAAGAHAMFFPCGVGPHDGSRRARHGGSRRGPGRLRRRGQEHPVRAQVAAAGARARARLRDHRRAGDLLHPPAHGSLAVAGHCAEFLDFDELDKWRDFGGVRNEEDYLITTGRRPPARSAETDDRGRGPGTARAEYERPVRGCGSF